MATTKIYKNTSKDTYIIPGVGEFPPKSQVSITTDFHYPVNLVNYPGLVEVTAEESKDE